MRKALLTAAAIAGLGSAMAIAPAAQAAEKRGSIQIGQTSVPTTYAQQGPGYSRGGMPSGQSMGNRGFGGGGPRWDGGRRWGGGRPYYGRPYYYGRDYGYGPGIVGGLAAGALIGSAIAAQQQAAPAYAPTAEWIAYCQTKYRSFDPATGTYLGYDGKRHYCQ